MSPAQVTAIASFTFGHESCLPHYSLLRDSRPQRFVPDFVWDNRRRLSIRAQLDHFLLELKQNIPPSLEVDTF